MTPLCRAAWQNNVETATVLIEAGAKVDMPDSKGITPLMWAVKKQNMSMIDYLFENGANPNIVEK